MIGQVSPENTASTRTPGTPDRNAAHTGERRQFERYPRGNLEVQIHRHGFRGILRSSPQTECVDYSRSGVLVSCDQHFEVGDKLIVDLSLNDICVEELNGVVCSRLHRQGLPTRYGIRFCFESHEHMRSSRCSHCLKTIATYLQRQSQFS